MKHRRRLALTLAAAASLGAAGTARQSLNRLQLDNGGDFFSWLNDPFIGGEPEAGDFTGDFYWKVYPGEVLRSVSGELDLLGLEYWVVDQDWDLDDATTWAYMVTRGVDSGDLAGGGTGLSPGNVEPLLGDPDGVLVPEVPNVGLGNPEGEGNCPPPGALSGWLVTETWEDPDTGEAVPLVTLVADGDHDYVYTAFFPDGQSATFGGVHCGGGGNATFQYYASVDSALTPEGGENLPDVLGTGYNAYGGRHFGDPQGQGFQAYVPHGYNRGAELALLFERPVLNVRVDAGIDGHGPETGLASLELPLGLDAGGLPTGTSSALGWRLFSAGAPTDGSRVGVAFASLAAPLDPPGIPLFGDVLLLPSDDPLFLQAFVTWGVHAFAGGEDGVAATSPLEPIDPQVALLNTAVYLQGFDVDLVRSTWVASPVTQVTFRPSSF